MYPLYANDQRVGKSAETIHPWDIQSDGNAGSRIIREPELGVRVWIARTFSPRHPQWSPSS